MTKRRSVESDIYAGLRVYNDCEAIQKGRVGRRILRRLYGKLTGRLARKIFG
jgi:hypothetical protein